MFCQQSRHKAGDLRRLDVTRWGTDSIAFDVNNVSAFRGWVVARGHLGGAKLDHHRVSLARQKSLCIHSYVFVSTCRRELINRPWLTNQHAQTRHPPALQYNFIAKCQDSFTRNVLWFQVHSSHIHSNHKTSNVYLNQLKGTVCYAMGTWIDVCAVFRVLVLVVYFVCFMVLLALSLSLSCMCQFNDFVFACGNDQKS